MVFLDSKVVIVKTEFQPFTYGRKYFHKDTSILLYTHNIEGFNFNNSNFLSSNHSNYFVKAGCQRGKDISKIEAVNSGICGSYSQAKVCSFVYFSSGQF